ncbi:hypothetical protein HPB50_013359 [Hyalomma asiaticum]|uniref:Uncharacterized protein n=1 Tax=Hyalomma asiaticum TaxID=266040 RepID=A0ACB7RQS9_HYAAI|nr:hypothetical protein HPB50_013359 [Hyalomma asiaticum]
MAPADEARLAEWDRRIKRTDRRLTPTAVVCEKYFDESFIERAFTITVNGVVNEIPATNRASNLMRCPPYSLNILSTLFQNCQQNEKQEICAFIM